VLEKGFLFFPGGQGREKEEGASWEKTSIEQKKKRKKEGVTRSRHTIPHASLGQP